jgi:glycosyltransferase involved in cell wall biosynthesis
MNESEVLTDIPGKAGRFWGDHTNFIGPASPPRWLVRLIGDRWAYNLKGSLAALRLFARRGRCRGIVTDGGASGVLLAYLQMLFPRGRKPHVMIDCLWDLRPGTPRAWFKRLRLRLAALSVHRFVVWAGHEVEDYARAFGLPREKLAYVPFHTTVHDYEYDVRDDGYLFAGGNSGRDYRPLIEAVRPLDLPVWIASTRPSLFRGVELPQHVRVHPTTPTGFRQAMAGARLVVIAMESGLLHSGGQQTCLNAMYMGKPTIAVGRKWAADFIEDGVTGLIVDYDDPVGLRQAIAWVLANPEAARGMGERARDHAATFTTERTMRAVYELAASAGHSQRADPRVELDTEGEPQNVHAPASYA